MWHPGRAHFLHQEHNLNKLGRGSVDNASYQISSPCGFRQEDLFHVFPILAYVKHVTPSAAHF